mmetsp:Transcript_25107/g.52884  ORF Transcript_25107/g.52884 Transcript_25107/m.52884 type:complete len:188 (-) Transcript_25107:127-690(-)
MKSQFLPHTSQNHHVEKTCARRKVINSFKHDKPGSKSKRTSRRRTDTLTVTFLDASSNEIIPHSDSKLHEKNQSLKWMTTSDRSRVRRELKMDIDEARQLLSNPNSQVTTNDLYKFVGLENMLSLKVVKRTISDRKLHAQSVLSEQFRQKFFCIHDEEEIRRAGEQISQASQDRAHALAMEYSEIED